MNALTMLLGSIEFSDKRLASQGQCQLEECHRDGWQY